MKVELVVIDGPQVGREFSFSERDRFIVGRSEGARLSLPGDPQISRYHFLIEVSPPELLLRDLNSRNGTFVNESPERAGEVRLRDGDRVAAGGATILVQVRGDHEVNDTIKMAGFPGEGAPLSVTRAPVLCLRCQHPAAEEVAGAAVGPLIWFCPPCLEALLVEPELHPDYKVIKELGRGNMGAVYLGLHRRDHYQRALKLILPHAAANEYQRELFLREARVQALLKHPHIVEVFDLVESAPGIFCIVMEYVEGTDAEKLLQAQGGPLPVGRACGIVAQALLGLEHFHARGFVHRDLKDANLMVITDEAGQDLVKVADCGLAKCYETSGLSGFTGTNIMGGSAAYMAPEQVTDFRGAGPRADLYSMGCVLYRLLTGELPLDGAEIKNPYLAALMEPMVPIRARNPAIPDPLARAVERALAKEPKERYGSAGEMRAAILDGLRAGGG